MKRERRTYCRYCYARIGNYRGGAIPCPSCGRQHSRANEEKFWTLEARLVKLERQAKIAALVPAIGLGAWLWIRAGAKESLGMGQMYAVLTSLVVYLLLWLTAAKITHRPTNLYAGTLWSVILPLTGASLASLGASAWSSEDGSRAVAIALFLCAAPALFLGPLSFKTTRWHRDWRTRYLAERVQEQD